MHLSLYCTDTSKNKIDFKIFFTQETVLAVVKNLEKDEY